MTHEEVLAARVDEFADKYLPSTMEGDGARLRLIELVNDAYWLGQQSKEGA